MILLKIYLGSVLFWFLLIVITGLIFRKKFLRGTEIISAYTGEKIEREHWLKTTLNYLFLSFIPLFRFLMFVVKMYITFAPRQVIGILEEDVEINEKRRFENDSNGK